ncbi:hypothetical protein ACVK1Q_006069 [Methylobacterium sp. PvP108]
MDRVGAEKRNASIVKHSSADDRHRMKIGPVRSPTELKIPMLLLQRAYFKYVHSFLEIISFYNDERFVSNSKHSCVAIEFWRFA